MPATLTERYITAVIGSIPVTSRNDVQAELTASIDDAIEARTEQGERRIDAERAVLTDLGDPRVLAAGFADRPLHLIGPRFYLIWWRILKLLWAIVPAVAMAGVALSEMLAKASISEIIGNSISTGLAVVVYLTFWVTLVFAVLERTLSTSALPDWNVDQLPKLQPKGVRTADLVASLSSISFFVLGIGVLFWDRFHGFVRLDSDSISILSPNLWPWWATGMLVLLAAEVALVVGVYLAGRWNATAAIVNTALALVFAISATALLATGRLVNPELIKFVFTENGVDADSLHAVAVITGATIIGTSVWNIGHGWLKAARSNRGG